MKMNVTDMKIKNSAGSKLRGNHLDAKFVSRIVSSSHPGLIPDKTLNTRGVPHTDYSSPQAVFTPSFYIG